MRDPMPDEGVGFPKDWQELNRSADLSLLPAGMLKQLKGQRQADADFSLLPSGWQEGVVE